VALKVLHLSTYDANGGAARAAYSLHRALLADGVASRMRVGIKQSDDPTVVQGNSRKFTLSSLMDRQLWRTQRSPRTTWRSPARFSSISASEINSSGADVVNLHWVTDGFISVEEIGKIKIPIVWSMYDMWAFSGTEHYGNIDSRRWRHGYTKRNRPADESGFDLDRWTFNRKVKSWSGETHRFHMVPASTWLESATRNSYLMSEWPITRIPHVIDLKKFRPKDQTLARIELNLPPDVPVVLFLASAGISDQRKGWDLLALALRQASQQLPGLHVVIAGPVPDPGTKQAAAQASSSVLHWQGIITSDEQLRTLYCAADLVAVPSLEDNMPLTAMEALSCGASVVAINIGGLPDIVAHGRTGYLAQPNDVNGLAQGLITMVHQSAEVREDCRRRAEMIWSPSVVVNAYLDTYQEAINTSA
jgi:glycosyltransferase involved in cell wall biosynthesis